MALVVCLIFYDSATMELRIAQRSIMEDKYCNNYFAIFKNAVRDCEFEQYVLFFNLSSLKFETSANTLQKKTYNTFLVHWWI